MMRIVRRGFLALWCICVLISFGKCYGQNESDERLQIFKTASIPALAIPLQLIKSKFNSNQNISKDCMEHVLEMINFQKPWAIQMMDAMGKIPAGIMQGSMTFIGSYDECLEVVAFKEPSGQIKLFQGQYCILSVNIKKILASYGDGYGGVNRKQGQNAQNSIQSLFWHGCFPSTCTPDEVILAGNILFSMMNIDFNTVISCEVKEPIVFDTAQIVAIAVYSVLGLFLFFGTLLDVLLLIRTKSDPSSHSLRQEKIFSFFLAFSLYTNTVKMLNTDTTSGNFGAINGIRFFSMTWVILGHTYIFINFSLIGNLMSLGNFFGDIAFQVVLNGTISVDVFFFLSGLLVAYVSMKEIKRSGRFNLLMFYFHRFWRLTPALGLMILSTFLLPLFGSGPFWKTNWNPWSSGCKSDWWTTILYINNLVKRESSLAFQCMGHSWYLANDMQFYVVSPLILFFLWRWKIAGLMMNTAFLLTATITPALLVMKYNYMPTLLPLLAGQEESTTFMFDIYQKPWCRMGPYCIGIFIGYLLSSKKRLTIHPVVQTLMWCLSIAGCSAVVYGTYEWNNHNYSSKEVNALYAATHRTAFAMGIAWMTYACCTGYGGIVNSILSWKPFIPLGRMTYMAYLVHPFVMFLLINSLRERVIISHYYMVVNFFGFLMISYAVAFVTSIAFETPFLNLEKVLLGKQQTNQPKQDRVDHHQNVINVAIAPVVDVVNGGKDNPVFTIP